MEEIWKPIAGYEGLYEVSNLGRVRSLDRIVANGRKYKGKIRCISFCRYNRLQLAKDRVKKSYNLHRLVALAFIPNPDNLPLVNHKDYNTRNNRADNLEWVSAFENVHYGRADNMRSRHQPQCRKIKQYTKDGKYIGSYYCIKEASLKYKIARHLIRMVCDGIYKQAGGYVWKYA